MIYWVEQRYVFPVEAESFEKAEQFAFKNRELIAKEVGPVTCRKHANTRLVADERLGWEDHDGMGSESYRAEGGAGDLE